MSSQVIAYFAIIYFGSTLICKLIDTYFSKGLPPGGSIVDKLSIIPFVNSAVALLLILALFGKLFGLLKIMPYSQSDEYYPVPDLPGFSPAMPVNANPHQRPDLVPLSENDKFILQHIDRIEISKWSKSADQKFFCADVSGIKIRIGLTTLGIAIVELGDNFYICHGEANITWRRIWQHFNEIDMKKQLKNSQDHDRMSKQILTIFQSKPDGIL